jgi:hypothetical protein
MFTSQWIMVKHVVFKLEKSKVSCGINQASHNLFLKLHVLVITLRTVNFEGVGDRSLS